VKGKFNHRLALLSELTKTFRPESQLLTKGDNNAADDTELYARDQDFIVRKDIVGSVVGYIPFVGYVTIMLSEHPWMKTVMLGIMGLVVVLQRE
jgi:signal peptidase